MGKKGTEFLYEGTGIVVEEMILRKIFLSTFRKRLKQVLGFRKKYFYAI